MKNLALISFLAMLAVVSCLLACAPPHSGDDDAAADDDSTPAGDDDDDDNDDSSPAADDDDNDNDDSSPATDDDDDNDDNDTTDDDDDDNDDNDDNDTTDDDDDDNDDDDSAGMLISRSVDTANYWNLRSVTFTNDPPYDTYLADVVIVPSGHVWTVQKISMNGGSANLNTFTTIDCFFYNDANGVPAGMPKSTTGSVWNESWAPTASNVTIYTTTDPIFASTNNSFTATLNSPPALAAGTYWLTCSGDGYYSDWSDWGVCGSAQGPSSPHGQWANPGGEFEGIPPATWANMDSYSDNPDYHMSFTLIGIDAAADDDDDNDDNDTTDDDDDDDTTEGVWTDPTTGYMWQVNPADDAWYDWPDAQTYCSGLTWGGYGGWMLPDIDSLRSLIRGCAYTETGGSCGVTDSCADASCWSYMCDICGPGGGPANGCYWPSQLSGACNWYWSSSAVAGDSGGAWSVDFADGGVGGGGQPGGSYVRCVRADNDDDDDDDNDTTDDDDNDNDDNDSADDDDDDDDSADDDDDVSPASGLCSADGWCWQNPLAMGNPLRAVWAGSPSEVFAVGDGGILHYDGSRWSEMGGSATAGAMLGGVWGSSPSDVYAVGRQNLESSLVLHYDGSSWAAMNAAPAETDYFVCVEGDSPTDVFFGGSGTIVHYDGVSWTTMDLGQIPAYQINAVWAVSPSDVYATMSQSDLLHYDGASWGLIDPGEGSAYGLTGLWGASATDVYVGGYDSTNRQGAIVHYDGASWTTQFINLNPTAIAGSSATDVFVIGGNAILHFDGSSWSTTLVSAGLNGIWALPGYASGVGYDGASSAIFQYDGSSWSDVLPRASLPSYTGAARLWGSSPSDIFAVGSTIWRYDGASWTLMTANAPPLASVWGFSPSDVYAVGSSNSQGVVMHYDGSSWSLMYTAANTVGLGGVWGASPSDVFAIGLNEIWVQSYVYDYGMILHYDGSSWATMLDSSEWELLRGIWGSSPSDVYVAEGEYVLHYDGTTWAAAPLPRPPSNCFLDVWGSSPSDVYVVGLQTDLPPADVAILEHYDGSTWSIIDISAMGIGELDHIWGDSRQDVFAVGGYDISDTGLSGPGAVLHYDGASWAPMNAGDGDGAAFNAVWGSSASDVFAVDGSGGILHYAGPPK